MLEFDIQVVILSGLGHMVTDLWVRSMVKTFDLFSTVTQNTECNDKTYTRKHACRTSESIRNLYSSQAKDLPVHTALFTEVYTYSTPTVVLSHVNPGLMFHQIISP